MRELSPISPNMVRIKGPASFAAKSATASPSPRKAPLPRSRGGSKSPGSGSFHAANNHGGIVSTFSQKRIESLEQENLNLKLQISLLEAILSDKDSPSPGGIGIGDLSGSSPQTLRVELRNAKMQEGESTRAASILEGQLADASAKMRRAEAEAMEASERAEECERVQDMLWRILSHHQKRMARTCSTNNSNKNNSSNDSNGDTTATPSPYTAKSLLDAATSLAASMRAEKRRADDALRLISALRSGVKQQQAKVTSREVNQDKVTSREVDQGKVTSREVNQGKVTSREVNQAKVTSREVNQGKVTSREVNQGKVTSREASMDSRTPTRAGRRQSHGSRREVEDGAKSGTRGVEEEKEDGGMAFEMRRLQNEMAELRLQFEQREGVAGGGAERGRRGGEEIVKEVKEEEEEEEEAEGLPSEMVGPGGDFSDGDYDDERGEHGDVGGSPERPCRQCHGDEGLEGGVGGGWEVDVGGGGHESLGYCNDDVCVVVAGGSHEGRGEAGGGGGGGGGSNFGSKGVPDGVRSRHLGAMAAGRPIKMLCAGTATSRTTHQGAGCSPRERSVPGAGMRHRGVQTERGVDDACVGTEWEGLEEEYEMVERGRRAAEAAEKSKTGGLLARQASAAGTLAGKMLLQRDNLIVSVDAALTRLYLGSQKGASSRQSSGSPWRVGRPLTDEAFVNCKSRIINVLNAWGEAQEGGGVGASGRLRGGRKSLQ